MSLSKINNFVKEVKEINPVNVDKWENFKLENVFDCQTAKQLLKTDIGDFPQVNRSAFNNGITKYVKKIDNKVNEENCITIGAEGFFAFYQEDKFMAGNKIYVLRNKKLNKINGLFICSVLNSIVNKYSYTNARILNKIKNEIHKFPINNKGELDWEYMEDYVKSLPIYDQKLDLSKIEELPKKIKKETKINLSSWKKFKLTELFNYKRGKRYKKGDHTSGKIAYISSSAKDNGIDNFVNPPSHLPIYEDCITIANSGSVGTCFYHNYKFVASDHVHVLWLKDMNLKREMALFLITTLEQNKSKFMFNKEISESTMKEVEFFLPTKDNNPNWEYMENYIKELDKKIKMSLEEKQIK